MIPTFFTNLALGTITAGVASIMALSSWIAGSQILQGNLFFDTTNNATPGIYVGTQLALSPTASGLNFPTNGSQTGVTLQAGGLTRYKTYPVTCTATGGLTGQYSTCYAVAPFSTTGTLLGVGLECGTTVSVGLTGDVSFKKSQISATGTVLTNLDAVSLGSGSNVFVQFATTNSWNPADKLTFSTRTTPTGSLTTARYDCQMWPVVLDKYGN